jgi:hypothetical protein
MGDDDPFWAWRSSWGPFSDQIAHPDSRIGGSGPGHSGRSRPGLDLGHSSHVPHPNSPAGRHIDTGEIERPLHAGPSKRSYRNSSTADTSPNSRA